MYRGAEHLALGSTGWRRLPGKMGMVDLYSVWERHCVWWVFRMDVWQCTIFDGGVEFGGVQTFGDESV